jgi:hypothetical protein
MSVKGEEATLEINADPLYLVEEQGREPWILPENALAIVMYSDGNFKLYDTRYFATDPKKCWDDAFSCMLLLRGLSGDKNSMDLLSAYLLKHGLIPSG